MTPALGWPAELFAEGGADVEEGEVLSMRESDPLSTLSYQATTLPAMGASAEVTAYFTSRGNRYERLPALTFLKHTHSTSDQSK